MSAQPGRGYLGISEVLAQLRPDFADISVSKIRFLETEGLITPARSPSGYRRFCAADVDRLRYILAAQRDQYLPLKVIKDRLDRFDQQDAAGRSGPGVPGGLPAQPGVLAQPGGRPGPGRPHRRGSRHKGKHRRSRGRRPGPRWPPGQGSRPSRAGPAALAGQRQAGLPLTAAMMPATSPAPGGPATSPVAGVPVRPGTSC